MKGNLYCANIFAVSLTIAAFMVNPVDAREICEKTDFPSPYGFIVELGNRAFRVCEDRSNENQMKSFERVSVPFDTVAVRELLSDFSEIDFLWGWLNLEDRDFDVPNEKSYAVFRHYFGEIELGKLAYQVFGGSGYAEDKRHNLQQGKLLQSLLVFRGSENASLPRHYLSCSGDLKDPPREYYHCNIYVDFSEADNLVAHSRLIWNRNTSPKEPFDFDNIGIYVEALVELFARIEVKNN